MIILDATWRMAKQMLHFSPNLQRLPRFCFTPPHLSRFFVRQQPNDQCFSTIEAIHQVMSLLDPAVGHQEGPRPYDCLLEIFDKMVAKQLSFRRPGHTRYSLSYLKRKERRKNRNAKTT
jgi:DTW domain-containing protein YfiP